MTGVEFEEYCAKLLKKKKFKKIEMTKASGDQGIDIIAWKHRKKYGVQCKLYEHPVGNKAIQEAYTGSRFYDCDGGAIVMTNSTFTRGAKEAAEKTEVMLWGEIPVPKRHHIIRSMLEWIVLAGILFGVYRLVDFVGEDHRATVLVLLVSIVTAIFLLTIARAVRYFKR